MHDEGDAVRPKADMRGYPQWGDWLYRDVVLTLDHIPNTSAKYVRISTGPIVLDKVTHSSTQIHVLPADDLHRTMVGKRLTQAYTWVHMSPAANRATRHGSIGHRVLWARSPRCRKRLPQTKYVKTRVPQS